MPVHRIESLLSCRLFQSPQRAGERLYFLSNLSGHLSLYAMDLGGSVPEPLLPPDVALHNPHLIDGYPFWVFPPLGRILVMVDHNGDEKYRPYVIPLDGGYPEPVFAAGLADQRVHLSHCSSETGTVYFNTEAQGEPMQRAFRANLSTGELRELGKSTWGNYVAGVSEDHTQVALVDAYTLGDHVLYLWRESDPQRRLLYGVPIEQRTPGQQVPLNSIHSCWFTEGGGLLFVTSLFSDTYGLGYLRLDGPATVRPVELHGTVHEGAGELTHHRLDGTRSHILYNIDGCSWMYDGEFDEEALRIRLDRAVCGRPPLANGVLDSTRFDESSATWAVSFSTATSPTQLYTLSPEGARVHTRERILGIGTEALSAGEDASFVSHDRLRISARLYLPSPSLGYTGARPLVYYIHGGPQSQERPDFAWFSMPLIQFLTLRGFAVFVPNVRGSTGYGLEYTKHVDRDWGGRDRLDHVHAMTHVLPGDPRVDVARAGVIGRSYGGYMTLTLAARHPELWRGAVDMFGVYNLFTFLERIPETWKPYFILSLGDPKQDRDFLTDRSPVTHIENLRCPLLVIQGRNDPRVVEAESHDLVERLRSVGKSVEYLLFEDEGHDVLKFSNRVRCYTTVTEFFMKHLMSAPAAEGAPSGAS